MELLPNRPKAESRQDLINLIAALLDQNDALEWPNETAYSFLQALAAWLSDAEGFYANLGEDRDVNTASWQLIADAVNGATTYE